ncbi:MAG: phage major capsid protein [Verrucomicrobia bacterium]|nr:phage major capsid protein [Verrucomicrobiota bacterium]
MKRNLLPRLTALSLLVAFLPAVHAAEEDPTAKFREALKNTMLKLRDAQGQLANAQAATIAAESKVAELTSKNEALTKDLVAERNTATNTITDLNKKIAKRDGSILELEASLAKWKKSYGEVTNLAAKRENQRAIFEAKNIKLERQVEEQQTRNIQMHKVGMEILDRYEKFGLGDAILAREPFTAAQRVKFQTLTQDFANDLTDARIPVDQREQKENGK